MKELIPSFPSRNGKKQQAKSSFLSQLLTMPRGFFFAFTFLKFRGRLLIKQTNN